MVLYIFMHFVALSKTYRKQNRIRQKQFEMLQAYKKIIHSSSSPYISFCTGILVNSVFRMQLTYQMKTMNQDFISYTGLYTISTYMVKLGKTFHFRMKTYHSNPWGSGYGWELNQ